jgi:hypothetical protein
VSDYAFKIGQMVDYKTQVRYSAAHGPYQVRVERNAGSPIPETNCALACGSSSAIGSTANHNLSHV